MKLELKQLNKSAFSALLFICVYQVFSLLMRESFVMGLVFLSAGILCARSLIHEQNNTRKSFHTNDIFALTSLWFALLALLITTSKEIYAIDAWFCILIMCTSILLKPAYSLRLNCLGISIFWTFAFLESTRNFIYIESALALTMIFLLSSIIQSLIYDLEARLNIARETDHLTGCIQENSFKAELEKVIQLNERYETPFSLICIQYQSRFNTEAELQTWLKELSCLYQSRLRKTDVLCRFTAQKFMILLPSTNIQNAEALSLDLENCARAYEFSFKRETSIVSEAPALYFSTKTFIRNESIDDWFRKIQT